MKFSQDFGQGKERTNFGPQKTRVGATARMDVDWSGVIDEGVAERSVECQ
jgi:hypothetical protein